MVDSEIFLFGGTLKEGTEGVNQSLAQTITDVTSITKNFKHAKNHKSSFHYSDFENYSIPDTDPRVDSLSEGYYQLYNLKENSFASKIYKFH